MLFYCTEYIIRRKNATKKGLGFYEKGQNVRIKS